MWRSDARLVTKSLKDSFKLDSHNIFYERCCYEIDITKRVGSILGNKDMNGIRQLSGWELWSRG